MFFIPEGDFRGSRDIDCTSVEMSECIGSTVDIVSGETVVSFFWSVAARKQIGRDPYTLIRPAVIPANATATFAFAIATQFS